MDRHEGPDTRASDMPAGTPPPARFVHVLTAVHGAGALVTFTMAVGSLASDSFRRGLALSEGSRLMVDWFGPWTWLFLLGVTAVLATLAYGSWCLRPWAWPMTLGAYTVGVLGSLWQVSIGIEQGWVGAVVNAAVVAYAARPAVRRSYRVSGRTRGTDPPRPG